MPAVSVENLLVLPRLEPAAHGEGRERGVLTLTTAPGGFEGEGFPVRCAFSGVDAAALDPFVHMDEMGEVDYAPGEPKGTPWHPHRGFETVTYMIDGTFAHRDSAGGGGRITNGDTQWMTAGAGILHIERPEELVVSGGLFHGIQLWVNLPARDKWIPPHYQDLRAGASTLLTGADGASLLRVIAGELGGHRGPGATHTPITFVHATLEPGATLEVPWPAAYNALVYVLSGSGELSEKRTRVHGGQLAVLGAGESFALHADDGDERLEVLFLGGVPIGEPVAWYGPFVMNTEAELQQAFEDYRSGRLGSIPAGGSRATVCDRRAAGWAN